MKIRRFTKDYLYKEDLYGNLTIRGLENDYIRIVEISTKNKSIRCKIDMLDQNLEEFDTINAAFSTEEFKNFWNCTEEVKNVINF